jgi:hypothetical protein
VSPPSRATRALAPTCSTRTADPGRRSAEALALPREPGGDRAAAVTALPGWIPDHPLG